MSEEDEQKKNMHQIDESLRILQNYLVDLKSELGYVAESGVAEREDRDPEVVKKFSDEGEPTIPGIFHQVNKANIHARHCLDLIRQIRGSEPKDNIPLQPRIK